MCIVSTSMHFPTFLALVLPIYQFLPMDDAIVSQTTTPEVVCFQQTLINECNGLMGLFVCLPYRMQLKLSQMVQEFFLLSSLS